ncbi:hypothetical protein CBS147321_752 [Aspergillus niger]|nr:hypothetical protein CBS147322_10733 [Aspergillus niger]KAI2953020.1 hypothetical protein CBS147321_752 [Aspergillus niger]
MEPHTTTTLDQIMSNNMNNNTNNNMNNQSQPQPQIPMPPPPQPQPEPTPLIEILICINAHGTLICIQSNNAQPTSTAIPIETIIANPTSYIFAFRDPIALHYAFSNQATYSLITRHAHYIRLYLLHDLQIGYRPSSPTPMPLSPLNIDNLFFYDSAADPNTKYITPPRIFCMPLVRQPQRMDNNRVCTISWPGFDALMNNWRYACRAIPWGHDIWYLVFNLASRGARVPQGVRRSLQMLSTAVCLKERVKGRFRCVVEGCSRGVVERFDEFLVANVAVMGWSVVGDDDEVRVEGWGDGGGGEGTVDGGGAAADCVVID